MAKFWVGGTGSLDGVTTTHIAATSGGVGGASYPTNADDLIFDSNSGAGTVTLSAALAVRSLQSVGTTIGTFIHNSGITITLGDATAGAGNVALDLSGFATYTKGGAASSALSFMSTSATTQTIKFGSNVSGNMTFNGVGGVWQFTSGQSFSNSSATLTFTAGDLDLSDLIATLSNFSSSGTGVRTLRPNTSALTFTSTGTAWTTSVNTSLTIAANTASITFSGAGSTFSPGTATNFNGASIVSTGSGTHAWNTGSSTFGNVTLTGTAVKTDQYNVGAFTCTGTFTATGNSAINRLFVNSSSLGSQRIITAAAASLTNVDFRDISGAGAATWSGSSVGNFGDNSGITFTPATTAYWIGNTGNWSATSSWSTSSGGSSGVAVPLPQDLAVFDNNSFSAPGQVVTIDMPRLSIVQSFGAANAPTFTFPASVTTSTAGNIQLFGGAGNLITVNSSVSGTPATLSKSGGKLIWNYVSLKDSTATGGATFFAGANSTNVSGNTGWSFTSPATKGAFILAAVS